MNDARFSRSDNKCKTELLIKQDREGVLRGVN